MAVAATSIIPQSASAQTAPDITLVHGIPGMTVDVAVDGTVVIDNFVPGSLANISSFAGQTLANVTVLDDATQEVIIGPIPQLVVPATGSHSIVAHFDAANTPVLTTFANNTNPTAEGTARFTLRHTAQASAIDLIIGDQRPIVAAVNGDSAELDLPDGELTDAQIAETGGVAVAQIATLDLAANTNTIVYVVGSTDDDTLDFVVQIVDFQIAAPTTTTGESTTTNLVPTAVNTGSPIDGSSSLPLIAVALGGLVLAGGAMAARRRV
ncbi:MAG: DUF4397 domain-containing protein [Ilumatobacteraceae bacterium]